jgi:hypothetical protein
MSSVASQPSYNQPSAAHIIGSQAPVPSKGKPHQLAHTCRRVVKSDHCPVLILSIPFINFTEFEKIILTYFFV